MSGVELAAALRVAKAERVGGAVELPLKRFFSTEVSSSTGR